MAEPGDTGASGGAGGEGGPPRSAARGTGGKRRKTTSASGGRGERRNPQVLEALRMLQAADPAMAAALRSSLAARGHTGDGGTPKLSRALEPLDAEQAHEVIQALGEAKGKPDAQAMDMIGAADGDVAQAVRDNALYRRISLQQSIETARKYLVSRHGEDDTDAGDDDDDGDQD